MRRSILLVRLLAALIALAAVAPPAGAQVTYSVTFLDPTNQFTPAERASMSAAVNATGADWGRYFQTPGPINLSVQVELNNGFPYMTGRSGDARYVNTAGGIEIFEQSAARRVRTGEASATPADILLTMNTSYLRTNLWFEANHTLRTESIPAIRTDAYMVFAHELGHAFFMNGWRNPNGSLTTMGPSLPYQSTWDQWITGLDNSIVFSGPNAVSVYGGPVPVTNGNPNHYGNPGGSLVPGPVPNVIQEGLMNGVVFHYQNRSGISALDLAMAKDAGMVLAPFRWTGTTGSWDAAANWNFDANAGPNIVVPRATAFDARIDRVTGTPYAVTMPTSVSLTSFTLASADATLQHTGGNFAVGTGTLTSGVYQVNGGTVAGGTWTSGGGRMRFTANTANAVANATLGAGVLDLSPANSYARFTGTTAFGTNAAGTTVGTNSVLALGQTTFPRGTVSLAGGSVAIEGNLSATLGANATISAISGTNTVGRYSATSGTGNLTNQGTLQATGASTVMTINPTGTLANSGTIRTTDTTARVNVQPGGAFTNGGTVSAYGTVTGGVTTSGTFKLNGTVTGALTVTGGVVGAGPAGPGALAVGSAAFRPGGAMAWQVKSWSAGATAGVGFDQITSAGALDLTQLTGAGQFTIAVAGLTAANAVGAVPGFDSAAARSWVIADFTNDLTGTPVNRFALDTTQFVPSNALNGGTFALSLTATGEVVLTFTPVPEPSLVLAAAGLGVAVVRRRGRPALAA